MILPGAWYQWAENVAHYFEDMGLDSDFAEDAALVWGLAHAYGLNPRITSTWRDPEKQKAMQERWDRGDRAGLRARPATNSKHTNTNWLGQPASKAMDMVTSNDSQMAAIARDLTGAAAGQYFNTPDPGHYYMP